MIFVVEMIYKQNVGAKNNLILNNGILIILINNYNQYINIKIYHNRFLYKNYFIKLVSG